jgi:hypothetical protein
VTLGPRAIAITRVISTLFFATTSVYCTVVASAFAYHQFIRPGLFGWLVWARNQYDALFLGVICLTLLALAPDLSSPARGASRWMRRSIVGFLLVWGLVAIGLFVFPVLSQRGSEERSLILATAALLPAAWLALIDHLACWRAVVRDRSLSSSSETGIAAATLGAAVGVWIVY